MPQRPLTRFVGRDEQLALLAELLADAARGEPGLALVTGEAGAGKSRLLAEAFADAGPDRALVLRGACSPVTGGGLSYAPFVAALRPVLDAPLEADGVTPVRRWPALGRLTAEADSSAGGRVVLFESVMALLRTLCEGRVVVVVLDDLHWADASTLDLVGYLAANLVRERVLLVLALRDDALAEGHPVKRPLAEIGRLPSCARVPVPPLDRSELAELAGALGQQELTDRALTSLSEASGGLPFVAEELVRTADRLDWSAPPASVRELLEAQLEQLEPRTRQVLAVAGVAGRATDPSLLAAVLGTETEHVHELLEPALRLGVLVAGEGEGVVFRHDLLRQTVLATLLPARRRELHRRIAQVLSTRAAGAGVDAELAHHLHRAGELGEALAARVRAAAEARRRAAVGDVATHLEEALRLWDQVDDPERAAGIPRAVMAQEAATSRWLVGEPHLAARWGRVALAEVPPEEDGDRFARLAGQQARYLFAVGDRGAAHEILEVAERATRREPSGPGRAEVLVTLAQLQMLSNEDRLALESSLRAARAAEEAGLAMAAVHARSTHAAALQALGHVEEGASLLAELMTRATQELDRRPPGAELTGEVNDPALVAGRVAHNAAFGLIAHGFPTRAVRVADEALDVVEQHHLGDNSRSTLRGLRAQALLALGETAAAGRVLAELPRLPPSRVRVSAMEAQIEHALRTGRYDEATAYLEAAGTWDELLTPLPVLGAELHLARGRPAEAAAVAEAFVSRADAKGVVPFVARGCALAAEAHVGLLRASEHVGDAAGVAAHRSAVEARAETARRTARRCRDAGPSVPPDTAAWLAVAEGWAADAAGTVADRAEAWATADRVATGSELRALLLTTGLNLARALASAGRREEAAEVLRSARTVAVDIDAHPFLARADDLAARARLHRAGVVGQAGPDGAAAFGLTDREREVLAAVVEGLTNHEIGQRLFISTKTASVHVSNILRKLDVPSRRAAAQRAREAGLVPSD